MAHTESNVYQNLNFNGSRFFTILNCPKNLLFELVLHVLLSFHQNCVFVKRVNEFDEICAKMDMRLYLRYTLVDSEQSCYVL